MDENTNAVCPNCGNDPCTCTDTATTEESMPTEGGEESSM